MTHQLLPYKYQTVFIMKKVTTMKVSERQIRNIVRESIRRSLMEGPSGYDGFSYNEKPRGVEFQGYPNRRLKNGQFQYPPKGYYWVNDTTLMQGNRRFTIAQNGQLMPINEVFDHWADAEYRMDQADRFKRRYGIPMDAKHVDNPDYEYGVWVDSEGRTWTVSRGDSRATCLDDEGDGMFMDDDEEGPVNESINERGDLPDDYEEDENGLPKDLNQQIDKANAFYAKDLEEDTKYTEVTNYNVDASETLGYVNQAFDTLDRMMKRMFERSDIFGENLGNMAFKTARELRSMKERLNAEFTNSQSPQVNRRLRPRK